MEAPGEIHSLLPKLYDKLLVFSQFDSIYKVFPVGLISSIGFYMWSMIYSIFYIIYKKDYEKLIPLALVLLITLTNFMGPIVLVRYYLFLIYSFPMMIMLVFSPDKLSLEQKEK